MKFTVKTTSGSAIAVQPTLAGDRMSISMNVSGQVDAQMFLTHDQASALVFGLEMAFETMEARRAATRRQAIFGLARHLDTTGASHA